MYVNTVCFFIRRCFLYKAMSVADYVRICGENEAHKTVRDNVKAQAANL